MRHLDKIIENLIDRTYLMFYYKYTGETMEIIRHWKNGRKDSFIVNELQNQISSADLISKPFEPKIYKPIEINGMPICIYKGEKLPGEDIVYLESKGIFVSSFGRVFTVNKIESESQKEMRNNPNNKWEQTSWYIDIPKYTGYVYHLVAEAFFEKFVDNRYDVHHISGNALDNRADNLIYLTREQHKDIEPDYDVLNKQLYQEIIKLDWENIFLNEPGINIVNNVEFVDFFDFNILLDFPYRKFKFYTTKSQHYCNISFDAFIGGSHDGLKYSKNMKVNGEGGFTCSGSKIDNIELEKIYWECPNGGRSDRFNYNRNRT
jgi:hypothetical protein